MLVHNTDTEQGFAIRFWGRTRRSVVDFEGLCSSSVREIDGKRSVVPTRVGVNRLAGTAPDGPVESFPGYPGHDIQDDRLARVDARFRMRRIKPQLLWHGGCSFLSSLARG
jgi:hypothetical protein